MEERWAVAELDAFMPAAVRTDLEERFWRPIEAQATLEALSDDPSFFADPGRHPAIFADHGVVHVRDVSIGLIRLLDTINGVLLPARPPDRQRFVRTVGVAQAYLHDIGMVDMTPTGRRVHAQVGAHAAFGDEIDVLLQLLLAGGAVRSRLDDVQAAAPFSTSLEVVVREMLSMTVAHSKSVIPAALLADRTALRAVMQRVIFTSLDAHRSDGWRPLEPVSPMPAAANVDRYADPTEAFGWLTDPRGPQAELADDVIDSVRALRAADVMRQRGTVLRTSGGFELCMDADTARAVCTLRPATGDAAYVITYDDERGAGEANIRTAFVTPRGHLRIAFHRGAFGTDDAERRAAVSVAGVIVDIQADVIPSFRGIEARNGLRPPTRGSEAIRIQLERPNDRPAFADDVATHVAKLEPSIAGRLVTVADTEGAASDERRRFFLADPVDGHGPEADLLLRSLAEHGVETVGIDRDTAFAEACRTTIEPGERLVARGSPPSFVYVPTAPGLVVRPDGGYAPSPLPPWVPVGTTGVIRRAERNSAIVATTSVDVIMIPGELFARAWLRPLPIDELEDRLRRPATARP